MLSLAPIQGITDAIFRKAHFNHIGGYDAYYAPYIKLENNKEVKASKFKDILPENNTGVPLVPQIMVNNADDFLFLTKQIEELGYNEVNWNLGCPYPMVTNRKLGSGLLPDPERIARILEEVLPAVNIRVSLKMRLGLSDQKDIDALLPLLDHLKLSEIIIHPRIAKQLYKGKANIELFKSCLNKTKHVVCYNGDIDSVRKCNDISASVPQIKHFMIGRGGIQNPFLAKQIKGFKISQEEADQQFWLLHDEMFTEVQKRLSGHHQVAAKMCNYWEYLSKSFNNSHKVFKLIKKAGNLAKYTGAIAKIKELYCLEIDQ